MGLRADSNDETCSIASDNSNADTDRIVRSTFPSPSPPNSPSPATFSNFDKNDTDDNNNTTTTNNSSNNNSANKDVEALEEEYSLLTHPAVVFASEQLSDDNYVSGFHTVKVFDFDQTLFQSPLPNPALWDPSFIGILTSWAYCGTGWWHNPGTLEMGPEIEASLWDGWWNQAIVFFTLRLFFFFFFFCCCCCCCCCCNYYASRHARDNSPEVHGRGVATILFCRRLMQVQLTQQI
jgi:hypothetical protein